MGTVAKIDCTTGETTYRPTTAREDAQRERDARAHAAFTEAQERGLRERAADLAAVRQRATTDPDFAALVRVLGLSAAPVVAGRKKVRRGKGT